MKKGFTLTRGGDSYLAPVVEIYETAVEAGFQNSLTGSNIDDWNHEGDEGALNF